MAVGMATLLNIAAFHSPASSSFNKSDASSYSSCPLPSLHRNLCQSPRQNHPRICASATKKLRGSGRLSRSNADLFNDIQEFLSTVGLPDDHVPSTKELTQHGRQDLANIVRRRGYKFIKELLATSTETQLNASSSEENLIGNPEVLNVLNEEVKNSSADISSSNKATKLKDQKIDLFEDNSVLIGASKEKHDVVAFVEDVSLSHGVAEANVSEGSSKKLQCVDKISSGQESSVHPSLQGKVTKFIQDGELETIEESGFELLNKRTTKDSEPVTELQSDVEFNSDTTYLAENDPVLFVAEVSNGSIASFSQEAEDRPSEMNPSRIESISTEKALMVNCKEDFEVEAQKAADQMEINRLKLMLHEKELELTQLKEQVEKEKLALCIFQTEVDKEISEAQKLVSEKDTELHATEESLLGLKEVDIQFWSEGEVVEVAGSFNGWHQRIKMDSQPSSSISITNSSQKSRLWRTLFRLYPGVYEIKFIVDGHWTVDCHRESITRGAMHNNILRVGRG